MPIWERGDKGGFALGSLGAFLVIEAREHAEKRGAKPLARLTAVLSDRSKRTPGSVTAALGRLWDKIKQQLRRRPRRRSLGRHRGGAGDRRGTGVSRRP